MKRIVILFLILATTITSMAQSVQLEGRSVNGVLPFPEVSDTQTGKVVVEIWVDNYGSVKKAISGVNGTTTSDRKAWEAARRAALSSHFNMSADSPALQKGSITYSFESEEKTAANPIQKTFFETITVGSLINENTFLNCPINKPEKSDISNPYLPFAGVYSTYTIAEGYEYGGVMWDAVSVMADKNNKIIGISFTALPQEYDSLFDAIITALEKKYGPPAGDDKEDFMRLTGWQDSDMMLALLGASFDEYEEGRGLIMMVYGSSDTSFLREKENEFMSAF